MDISQVRVATRPLTTRIGGRRYRIRRGDLVQVGHPLLDAHARSFAELQVGYLAPQQDRQECSEPSGGDAEPDQAAVRAWAIAEGYDVSPRGRVPGDVVAAYKAAHGES